MENTMKRLFLISIIAATVIIGCDTITVINFDDLSSVTTTGMVPVNPGDSFKVGKILVDNESGVKFVVLPFQWSAQPKATPPKPAKWDGGGDIEIVNTNQAGGSGNEIHFNNATLGIITPTDISVKKVQLKFGEYGGNVNLIENSFLHNKEDFNLITSPTGSGTTITVAGTPPMGTLTLSGKMDKFFYTFPAAVLPAGFAATQKLNVVVGGGQELWIDDVVITQ
jgi:hypothetical protein